MYFVCHNVKLTNSKEIAGHFGWKLWKKCSMSQSFHPLRKLSAGMCRSDFLPEFSVSVEKCVTLLYFL